MGAKSVSENEICTRYESRMVKLLCDSKNTNSTSIKDVDVWIERIIEEDSVSEDEEIDFVKLRSNI